MDFSRDSFYRLKQIYDQGGELALADINHKGKPRPKNIIDPDIRKRIVAIALDNPVLGQQRVSNKLREMGACFSRRCKVVWLRHDMESHMSLKKKSYRKDGY